MIDGFEGIDSKFCRLSVINKTEHNLLIKAQRYGQWWLLKALLPEHRDLPAYQEMLRKEFEMMIQMHHPNIVRTFSLEKVEGYGMCIVMEWIEGITLSKFIDSTTDSQTGMKVVDELVDALDYIHKKGVVHRDLKPDNVMITSNGSTVKLIDFGLADSDAYTVLKQPGGTDGYMSPEQVSGANPDVRNDIYSLGVIIKEMNLGRRFDKIEHRCMAPIERRYQNISELGDALHDAMKPKFSFTRYPLFWAMAGILVSMAVTLGIIMTRQNADNALSDDDEYEPYVPEDLKSGEEPTLKIVNPDFHNKSTFGWTVTSNIHPGLVNVGNITACQFYIQTFDMWQMVHGLEPGRYELSVRAFHRPDSGNWSKWHYEHAKDKENGTVYSTAELYADTASVRILNWAAEANSEPLPDDPIFCEELVDGEVPQALTAAGYYFNHGHYENHLEFILEGKDSVRIGIRLPIMRDKSLSWVAFDRFRLKKIK